MTIAFIPREEPREAPPVTSENEMLRQLRSYTCMRIIAHVVAGDLKVYLYDDDQPDAIEHTITVATSGVTCCSITQRGCGTLDMLFCQNGTLKWAKSSDEGVTWTIRTALFGTPPVPATGYSLVEHGDWDGTFVTMLYRTADSSWYCNVGGLGHTHIWDWPDEPHLVGPGRKSPGTLRWLQDGVWQFACVNAAGEAITYTCRWTIPTESAMWTSSTSATGYRQIAQHVEDGMYVQPIYNPTSGLWQVVTGLRHGKVYAWQFGAVQTLTAGKAVSGSLIRSGAGHWEFAYVPTGTNIPAIKRCKDLTPSGVGIWT